MTDQISWLFSRLLNILIENMGYYLIDLLTGENLVDTRLEYKPSLVACFLYATIIHSKSFLKYNFFLDTHFCSFAFFFIKN